MSRAYKWLDRRILPDGPFLTLCLSEAEYLHAMRHCKIKDPSPWITSQRSNATTHFLSGSEGRTAIVCLKVEKRHDPIQVVALLVHEAVHVWQEFADDIGEKNPGSEQEAYAIQAFSQRLLYEYARRLELGFKQTEAAADSAAQP